MNYSSVISAVLILAPGIAIAEDGRVSGPAQRESSGDAFDQTPENGTAAPSLRPKYRLTRWLEDWRALSDKDKRTDRFDSLKYLALDKQGDTYFTFSGQWREDAIVNNGTLFESDHDFSGLHRIYVGADLHLGQARIFSEIANTFAIGLKGPPGPADETGIDLQLLFADYRLPFGQNAELIGRIGRQELMFDPTQRFVGVREGPNNRQAFDAVRLNLKTGAFHLSAFASRPVSYERGAFDDGRNKSIVFRGLYATHNSPNHTQSLYLYGYNNDLSRFGTSTGPERRTATGGRFAGRIDNVDYDVEAMRQTGSFAGQRIRAWALGSLAGYTFKSMFWTPRIGIQADVASGDRNPADNKVTTFNPLFFKGGYFLEAPVSSFANIRHLKGSLSLRPDQSTSISVSYGHFRKLRLGDAVYASPLIARPQTRAMVGQDVGNYIQLLGSHQFDAHLSLSFEFDRFNRSDALRAVGGKNIDHGKLTANFLF